MPKVLIVDDALTDRVRVSGIASRWMDCTILEADNGKSAMEQIAAHLPDLVLTDLHMPEMDGLELVAAVKEDFPHIPVILMTGQGNEDVAALALRQGAASYVPKVRLADDLVSTLNQVHSAAKSEQSQSHLMHYLGEASATFQLPNDPMLIRACVNHLMNMLRCLPLGDETERLRVGIAVQEAVNNAYYHGNLEVTTAAGDDHARFNEVAMSRCYEEPYMQRRISVTARINREQAEFIIRHDGPGFDFGSVNGEDAGNDKRGRGMTLMESTMDEVRFSDDGTEVTMVRHAAHDECDVDEEE